MTKIGTLRKKVDINIKAVDNLMLTLETTKENAKLLLAQAQTELDEAEEEYNSVKAGYEELKNRCTKVWKFVDKIFGE